VDRLGQADGCILKKSSDRQAGDHRLAHTFSTRQATRAWAIMLARRCAML